MTEVFPRRNLGQAEDWGRKVEGRVRAAERTMVVRQQSDKGGNRNDAASLAQLGNMIDRIGDAITAMPVFQQRSASGGGFDVPAANAVRASTSFTVPAGKTTAQVVAYANAQAFYTRVGPPLVMGFAWPFPLSTVSGEFGPRINPITGLSENHNGIDFAPGGNPVIYSPNEGYITQAGWHDLRGNWIEMRHDGFDQPINTRYLHMRDAISWSVGQFVHKGDTLGVMGTTGQSTGTHLHWETHLSGTPVNPRGFMNTYGEGVIGGGGGPLDPLDLRIHAYLRINGTLSPDSFPEQNWDQASGDTFSLMAPNYGRTFAVTPGQNIPVQLELSPPTSGAIAADGRNYANLTTLARFT